MCTVPVTAPSPQPTGHKIMESEFNNHEEAMANINEALAWAFDAQSLLKKLGDASPDLRKLAKRIDRVCLLLDRPWPMIDANSHVTA